MSCNLFPQLPHKRLDIDRAADGQQIKLCSLAAHGKRKGERAPLAGFAFDPDSPAMIFDNLPADRQAQACALWLVGQGIAHLFELLEDFGLVTRGNANSGVRYADDQFPALQTRPASYRPGVGEFDSVRN